MGNIFRLLTAAAATVFVVSTASAEIRAYPAADSAGQTSAIPAGYRAGGGGFRGGGFKAGGFRGGGMRGFRGGGMRGMRGGGRHTGRVGGHHAGGHHVGGHHAVGHAGHHAGHNAGHHAASSHGRRAGSVYRHNYNGHRLSHKVLGNGHLALVGHSFKHPGGHLHGRLDKLRGHHWHSHYNHVVIVGVIGGVVLCDLYCEFDVPVDVYGDFVAAVDEAEMADAEAAAFAADEAALAGVPAEEVPAKRVEQEQGWNKAVAILEEAAAQEDQEVAEAQKTGGEVEAVIDQPDEQVEVVADEEKKG